MFYSFFISSPLTEKLLACLVNIDLDSLLIWLKLDISSIYSSLLIQIIQKGLHKNIIPVHFQFYEGMGLICTNYFREKPIFNSEFSFWLSNKSFKNF